MFHETFRCIVIKISGVKFRARRLPRLHCPVFGEWRISYRMRVNAAAIRYAPRSENHPALEVICIALKEIKDANRRLSIWCEKQPLVQYSYNEVSALVFIVPLQ